MTASGRPLDRGSEGRISWFMLALSNAYLGRRLLALVDPYCLCVLSLEYSETIAGLKPMSSFRRSRFACQSH